MVASRGSQKHTAANESLELTLHEQRGTAFEITVIKLVEEGLQVLAYGAVQHPMLRGAPDIGSTSVGTGRGVKPHES